MLGHRLVDVLFLFLTMPLITWAILRFVPGDDPSIFSMFRLFYIEYPKNIFNAIFCHRK